MNITDSCLLCGACSAEFDPKSSNHTLSHSQQRVIASPVNDARNLRFMYNFVSRENVILKNFIKRLFKGEIILRQRKKTDGGAEGDSCDENEGTNGTNGTNIDETCDEKGDDTVPRKVYDEQTDMSELTLLEDVVKIVSERQADL